MELGDSSRIARQEKQVIEDDEERRRCDAAGLGWILVEEYKRLLQTSMQCTTDTND